MLVMVLTYDPAMGEMLAEAVRHVRHDAEVRVVDRERDAIECWLNERPQALVVDSLGNLSDGVSVIRAMRQTAPDAPLVILTRDAKRSTLETARRFRASAMIVKPISLQGLVSRLKQALETVIQAQRPDFADPVPEDWFQGVIAQNRLSMPVSASVKATLLQSDHSTDSLQSLHAAWKTEPAIVARLLGASNTSAYNENMVPCESLGAALQQLGVSRSVTIVDSLVLHCGSVLQDPYLVKKSEQLMAFSQRVGQKAVSLAARAGLDPAACFDAGLLSTMGELAALEVMQCWLDNGHNLEQEQVDSLVAHYAIPMSHQLKRAWRIPMSIRDRAGSVHQLPEQSTVSRDRMVMRLAGLMVTGDDPALVQRLQDLLGLDSKASAR